MSSQPVPIHETPIRIFRPEDILPDSESTSLEEQQYRAAAYSILAALLRDVPSQETLNQVAEFAKVNIDEDEMLLAMSSLGLAVQAIDKPHINNEYHELFIGLGRGELVPYGSWYLTGYLMEKPLSLLRDDLKELGFERDESMSEPEDHIAALCEVMSMLISDSAELHVQANFYEKHIGSWCERFFKDLENTESASFYQSVGRFGSVFMSMDKHYLQMPV